MLVERPSIRRRGTSVASSGRGRIIAAALVGAMALMLGACTVTASADEPSRSDSGASVRVAGGPDAETQLLAMIMVELLEREGLGAEVVPFADSRDSRRALEFGAVDVRLGYTGEAWLETLGRADPPGDPHRSFLAVRDHDAAVGIIWLRPRFSGQIDGPPADATFAFVVQSPPSIDADLRTMSQLAARLSAQPDALVCVDEEFASRPDGLPAVLSAYSVRSDRPFLAADPAQAVFGVSAGECLAGLTTATDGDAWRAGLQPLADDLGVFPAFVAVPQVRYEALREQPGIRVALSPLVTRMSTGMLAEWNGLVRSGVPMAEVAAEAANTLAGVPGSRDPNGAVDS